MNTDRLEALLWARVDGTIDPEELAELEAHLAKHPEPPEIERQITTIAEVLETLEIVQPPSELRGRIDSALDNATPHAGHTDHQMAPARARSAPAWPARLLPLAASVLIGVAIGYLLHPTTSGSIDQSVVTGTMVTPPGQPETGRVEVQLDAGAGSVMVSRSGTDVVVDVTLTTEINLGFTLTGTDGPVRFESLSSTEGSATEVTTGQGWVMVRTHGPGAVALSISVSNAEDMLMLQVSTHGAPAEEHWIGPSRNEPKP